MAVKKPKEKKPVKTKQQKYYAVKDGKGVRNKIYRTWNECKAKVHKYPAIYKSFVTEEEALNYLSGIKEKDVETVREMQQLAMKFNKEKKAKEKIKKIGTTAVPNIRLKDNVYEAFMDKCKEYDWKPSEALSKLIVDWID